MDNWIKNNPFVDKIIHAEWVVALTGPKKGLVTSTICNINISMDTAELCTLCESYGKIPRLIIGG